MNRTLYWLPRTLAIFFTSYLAVFAFDVFGAYKGWSVVLALFMHLIPAFILLIITIIAWKTRFGRSWGVLGLRCFVSLDDKIPTPLELVFADRAAGSCYRSLILFKLVCN